MANAFFMSSSTNTDFRPPYAVWNWRYRYKSGCVVPDGAVINNFKFSLEPQSFSIEVPKQYVSDDEMENKRDADSQELSEMLRQKATKLVEALNLRVFRDGLGDFFQLKRVEELGPKFYWETKPRPRPINGTGVSVQECQSLLDASMLPTDLEVKRLHAFAKIEGLQAMLDQFILAKQARETFPRQALLLAFMVMETAAWHEAWCKRADPAAKPESITTNKNDVRNLWGVLNLCNRLPQDWPNEVLKKHVELDPNPPPRFPALRAIANARNKRLVGHGVAIDPLPGVRLPIDEALIAAREMILAYGDHLGL